jgi:hypothetical protein
MRALLTTTGKYRRNAIFVGIGGEERTVTGNLRSVSIASNIDL